MNNAILQTDIGWARITGSDAVVTGLFLQRGKPDAHEPTALLREAARQVEAYMQGRLQAFDLPLQAEGSAFAKSVWAEMLKIPYGRTRTYGDVANALKAPAQLVGQACGQNPIGVIIPCHRIIGTNWLGGYTSDLGVDAKAYLLDLECGQQRLLL
ncbi:MAG TPA: methylated-DNA--[protein]-cysteine S-methyltransferase [Dongiaceae bacterium]|nr:methylated-DNA--[protein]-cysteine S-methyltransferase [Dongiaceae bacterium]